MVDNLHQMHRLRSWASLISPDLGDALPLMAFVWMFNATISSQPILRFNDVLFRDCLWGIHGMLRYSILPANYKVYNSF